MSKERLPERSGWKDRLLEPDALPEWKIADKEASWDRLHQRLGNPRRLIGSPWYRNAAAMILFIVGMSAFFRERSAIPEPVNTPGSGTRPVPVRLDPYRSMALKLSGETYHTMQTRPGLTGRRVNGVEGLPGRPRSVNRRLSHAPVYSFDSARFFSAIDSLGSPLLNFRPDPAQIAGTNRISPLAPVAGKKLRVISINELDHPSGPGSSMAGGTAPKRLGFIWNNHGSSGATTSEGQTGPDRSSANTLIKINLSPQN